MGQRTRIGRGDHNRNAATQYLEEKNRGCPEAEDVPQQHPFPARAVEGERPGVLDLQALPFGQAAARRLPHLRHLQRPRGHPGLSPQVDASRPVGRGLRWVSWSTDFGCRPAWVRSVLAQAGR